MLVLSCMQRGKYRKIDLVLLVVYFKELVLIHLCKLEIQFHNLYQIICLKSERTEGCRC